MNLEDFLKLKKELLTLNPSLKDYSNHNLYSFFKDIKIQEETRKDNYYRCHIVEDYLKLISLPDSLKTNIGASKGVRQSLEVLMNELESFIIPEDVYPFYQKTLQKNNKTFSTYRTLGVSNIFENIPDGTLLVCSPLKPQGRNYTGTEIDDIKIFLQRNNRNMVVVDLVYSCNFSLPKEWVDLYQSNQVILLHSLSKMFLKPMVFGMCFLPDTELGLSLRKKFQTLEKDENLLHQAFNLIHHNKHIPEIVKKWIINKGLQENFNVDLENPSYLYYSEKSFDDFLSEGKIVIPASVFGGIKGSIVSILNHY